MASRRMALLLLAAAVHAACWTPPIAVRGRIAAQRRTALLVDQAAPFRVTMRPDAAGALGVEVDANDCGAAVITSIVRGSHVSELLEVGDVVVQVNGCDTPTLGAVVEVVSAQELAAFVLTMARPKPIDRAESGEVPNQCCERGCRNCPWDYQGGHKNAQRRAKKRTRGRG